MITFSANRPTRYAHNHDAPPRGMERKVRRFDLSSARVLARSWHAWSAGAVSLCWMAIFVLAFAAPRLWAQGDEHPVRWSLKVKNSGVKPGARVVALVTAKISPGWHVYSITQPRGGPVATTITVPENPSFRLVAPITGPKPDKAFDPNFQMETELYEDSAVFKLPLLVKSNAPPNSTLRVGVYFQTCNAHLCLPPARQRLSAAVHVFPATWFPQPNGKQVFEKTGSSVHLVEEFTWRVQGMMESQPADSTANRSADCDESDGGTIFTSSAGPLVEARRRTWISLCGKSADREAVSCIAV